jgi:hypothetical protein
MDKSVPVRNVTIDYRHVSLEKTVSRHWAEVHHRDLRDQFRVTTLKLFQQRTGGPEKANKDNASAVAMDSGAGCADISGHVIEITETKLF